MCPQKHIKGGRPWRTEFTRALKGAPLLTIEENAWDSVKDILDKYETDLDQEGGAMVDKLQYEQEVWFRNYIQELAISVERTITRS